MRHRLRIAVSAVIAAALLTGCSNSGTTPDHAPGEPDTTAQPSPRPAADELPRGMVRLGQELPHDDEDTWVIKTGNLKTVQATAKAKGLPSGWLAVVSDFAFTNTTNQIQNVPSDLALTARYGPDGHTAPNFTDTGVVGLPLDTLTSDPEPIRVEPGGTHTTQLGFAVPRDAAGQPLTLTLEDGWNSRYVEGTIPGAAAHPVTASRIHPVDESKKSLAFGDWHDGDEITWLRAAPVKVTGTDKTGQRTCQLDLTFFNPDTEVSQLSQTPLDANVHVYYGSDLKQADTVKEWLGLKGTFIAPQRTATVTAHFTLPPVALPGPISIEIGNRDGHRVTYAGEVGN
ncbi:hypothetical protein ACIA8E_36150 [Streptomyces sp. NPDC051664]|uniref:hypothetical protein n=1 Tax=Streptomyces sp. NPDC051664 TaxID=3365668 RepID=UPI0037B45F5A